MGGRGREPGLSLQSNNSHMESMRVWLWSVRPSRVSFAEGGRWQCEFVNRALTPSHHWPHSHTIAHTLTPLHPPSHHCAHPRTTTHHSRTRRLCSTPPRSTSLGPNDRSWIGRPRGTMFTLHFVSSCLILMCTYIIRMHRHDHQLTSKVNLIFDYVEMRALHVRQS